MKRPSNNSLFLATFIALCFFSGLYLASVERKDRDFQEQKHWSAVYLMHPESADLSFVIENYEGEPAHYAYTILNQENAVILEGEANLNPRERKEVVLQEKVAEGRVVIRFKEQEKVLKVHQ